jgi:hypothetical protein
MKNSAVFLILLMLVAANSFAADTSSLIRESIISGSAEGYVDGPVFEKSRKQLNATGVLHLKVKKLYDFKQDDCARLHLYFKQSEALLPGESTPHDYMWETQMSLCLDGQAPTTTAKRGT